MPAFDKVSFFVDSNGNTICQQGSKCMDFGVVNANHLRIAYNKWMRGDLVQDAFPFLTADQREFMISGLLPEEFEALMSQFEED